MRQNQTGSDLKDPESWLRSTFSPDWMGLWICFPSLPGLATTAVSRLQVQLSGVVSAILFMAISSLALLGIDRQGSMENKKGAEPVLPGLR